MLLLPLAFAGLAFGQVTEAPLSAGARALGGTSVADRFENAAVVVNPALLGLERRYDLTGVFSVLGPGIGWSGAAVDARTSEAVALGVAYRGQRVTPELKPDTLPGWTTPDEELKNTQFDHQVSLGLAFPLARRQVAFGLSGTLALWNGQLIDQGRGGQAGAGLAWRPHPEWTLGLGARDLVPLDTGLAAVFETGLRYDRPGYAFAAQGGLQASSGQPLAGAGLELARETLRARLGWAWDPSRAIGPQRATLGLALAERGAGELAYAFEAPLIQRGFAEAMVHSVSFTVAAPSAESWKDE
jgi:hypothetical protein